MRPLPQPRGPHAYLDGRAPDWGSHHPGVMHQDVELALFLQEALHRRLNRQQVGEIKHQQLEPSFRLWMSGRYSFDCALAAFGGADADINGCILAVQDLGQLESNPGCCTSYYDNLTENVSRESMRWMSMSRILTRPV
jgi:hypothetical protein